MEQSVALIPARGGSQRIPRKNIREFAGIPSLTRVVRALEQSGTVSEVIVSTDDHEIAEVARAAGASVPFMRPPELADNFTGARPVIQHALREMGWSGALPVGVFYPTAVLTTTEDIQDSAALLDVGTTDFVMSVAQFDAPVERALRLDSRNNVSPREEAHILTRSQDLKSAFHDIGQFYWGFARSWLTPTPVVQSRCRAFVVDSWRAVDIDTPEDWTRAEMVFRMHHDA